ncbi:MAG TPA: nucleotidyltransferase domain-containing protein [Nitriliruptorales bacterium]
MPPSPAERADPVDSLRPVAAAAPGLKLLLLHGSRARGDEHPGSDWDLGYLADPTFDAPMLHGVLARLLGTDDVDLVDLARASALLRYRAARDGCVVHDAGGAYETFWLEAVDFWCDAGPLIRAGYEDTLARLP